MDLFIILTLLVAIPSAIAAFLNIIKILCETSEKDTHQENVQQQGGNGIEPGDIH